MKLRPIKFVHDKNEPQTQQKKISIQNRVQEFAASEAFKQQFGLYQEAALEDIDEICPIAVI